MNFLRQLPLKRKLTLITVLTSCVALVVACLALATYEQINIRHRLISDLATTAAMTGVNSTAGLTFNDATAVEQTLKSLAAQPRIVRACVYGKDERPFAQYQRATETHSLLAPPPRAEGHRFTTISLELFQPISLDGEVIGIIFIESDLQEIRASLWRFVIVLIVLLVACSFVALLVAARLQTIISRPIADLARTAARVANERDYSVRAIKESDDELGKLMDGFNHMLTQIQAQDEALHKSHLELERRVQERTSQLANSLSLTRATLEATADGILVADGHGRVTSFNERFLVIWNIPRALGLAGEEAPMLEIALSQLREPDIFIARVKALYADREAESFDVLEFLDGRVFELFSRPQRIGEISVGRVWSFRDITERKRAEAALAKLHQDLLESSRRAGMAEVATGVLHNVGNVLNSVNVGATCIADQVSRSKAPNLARVAGMLRENQAQLTEYVGHDPKGRQLLPYLAQLAEHLAGEQAVVLKETSELQKHIEHIKDIVAMQQSFAKVSGIAEPIKVADLLEDALRMNQSGLQRHGITVIKDYKNAPVITVEKHKALQILVNLLRNAKQACEHGASAQVSRDEVSRDQGAASNLKLETSNSIGAGARAPKTITLRVLAEAERVAITVGDNGVGIPAENLTRIFSHGFTTKQNGHGFGLHSGALAAQEMGGALRVASSGTGHGAEFTLELPIKPGRRSGQGSSGQVSSGAEVAAPGSRGAGATFNLKFETSNPSGGIS